ncbi:hypothetical protein [Alloacidobacterium sp.]|uniref:hypothetical protein n=1 Tax=Alloacidobacterium sp. TaxID=2951999 RepID=UPI002D5BAC5E|nr:hypothetical protein [Alloacidobacterium sp.]HYK37975.1 hypothetical protein [Alloacidobacterium sp.]
MAIIQVPRPPKDAMNPNRPANALLLSQVEHMHEAEKRLPLRYRTDIYVNAIKTEGEVANYIREVTAAIHRAHVDAARQRVRPAPKKRAPVLQIAAVAEESAPKGPNNNAKNKKTKVAPKKK